jgi:hypothetical protein
MKKLALFFMLFIAGNVLEQSLFGAECFQCSRKLRRSCETCEYECSCCNTYLDLGFGWGWDRPWGWSSSTLGYSYWYPSYYHCADCDYLGPYAGPYFGVGYPLECCR